MKRLSERMRDLIIIAEALQRQLRSLSQIEIATINEITRVAALPAESRRRTHAAMAMIAAIEGLQATDGMAPETTPWMMLIGAILPLLRIETFRQLCAEREMPRG